MRKRFDWLFLVGALLLATTEAHAQNYFEVPPVDFTGPLSHARYESGGFYVLLEGLYWSQDRPLKDQTVAYRGFVDVDGSITGKEGTFVGSHADALNTTELWGPGSWQPGFNLGLGWRFDTGTTLTLNWIHLVDAKYSATASLAPPNLNGGQGLADTYLFSPVFNFPINYAGPPFKVNVGNPGATFGIWNAASLETISYVERFDMVDLTMSVPIWQTDNYRNYGLVGPGGATLYDKFAWRTVSSDVNGLSNASDVANYHNITSNRLYGASLGMGNEWFIGDTPVGAFSVSIDLKGSLYADLIKGRAGYQLGDGSTEATRSRNMASIVPGLSGKINLLYFPWEAVELRVGYSFLALFNTYASPYPIDFNYGTIDPQWSPVSRLMHGFNFSVSVVF